MELAFDGLWVSTLFLAPAALWLIAIHRWGPNVQSLACRCVLASCLFSPIAVCSMSWLELSGWRTISPVTASVAPVVHSTMVKPATEFQAEPTFERTKEAEQSGNMTRGFGKPYHSSDDTPATIATQTTEWLRASIQFLWLGCSTILITRLLRALRTIQRMCRQATPDLGWQAQCQRLAERYSCACPTVVRSREVTSPCLVGIFRPTILLPVDLCPSHEQMEGVFVHELAHVARRDCFWNFLFQVTLSCFPLQPLLWWLASRQELAAEEACDDFVVQTVGRPALYAQQLLDLAATRLAAQPLGVGMIARSSTLSRRIRRLMNDKARRSLRTSLFARLSLTGVALVGCLLLSWCALPAASANQQQVADSDVNVVNQAATSADEGWLLAGRVLDVNGQPAVSAIVTFSLTDPKFHSSLATDDQGRFRQRVDQTGGNLQDLEIRVEAADKQSLSLSAIPLENSVQAASRLEIKLEPLRTIQLKVVDADDRPVDQAKAVAQIANSRLFATTDSSGVASFSVPKFQRIVQVAAWKDNEGLDFVKYEATPTNPFADSRATVVSAWSPEFPRNGLQQLTLTYSKPITVLLTDSEDRPIVDAKLKAGHLIKNGSQFFEPSFFDDCLGPTTDQSGRVELRCLPRWQTGSIKVWPSAKGYEVKFTDVPLWTEEPVRIKMERLVRISGQVLLPDRRPARNLRVIASGDSYNASINEGSAWTDAAGRYEMFVPPRHLYMVGIKDSVWAVKPQEFLLAPGQHRDNVDFVVRKATKVAGKEFVLDTTEPNRGQWMFVKQASKSLRSANTALPKEYANGPWHAPVLSWSAKTDDKGRYEFMLGDGNFELFPAGASKGMSFQIEGQPEIEFSK